MRLALLVFMSVVCLFTSGVEAKHPWLTEHAVTQELLRRTNEVRARSGVGPLVLDDDMCLAAYKHATNMSEYKSMYHSGLPYMEAICQSQINAESAIGTWVASPPHHGILLSGTRVGFGYQNRHGVLSWVTVVR